MSTEETKGQREIEIATDFLDLSEIGADRSTLRKLVPPEPDLQIRLSDGRVICIELVELCDSNLASSFANPKPDAGGVQYIRSSDPTGEIVRRKLYKNYNTTHPIYLLCYTDSRIATPHNVIVPTIERELRNIQGPYAAVWLMHRKTVLCLREEA